MIDFVFIHMKVLLISADIHRQPIQPLSEIFTSYKRSFERLITSLWKAAPWLGKHASEKPWSVGRLHILILTFTLWPCLPSVFHFHVFPSKTPHAFLLFTICTTCPAHLILPYLITWLILLRNTHHELHWATTTVYRRVRKIVKIEC
jgi:hypothetical protein